MLATIIQPATGADNLTAINAVPVSPAQLDAAMHLLEVVPGSARDNALIETVVLQSLAAAVDDNTLAAAALQARAAALTNWIEAHDPDRQSNAEAVVAAAARFPLVALEDGIGFEPSGFQEMILFIEELPW